MAKRVVFWVIRNTIFWIICFVSLLAIFLGFFNVVVMWKAIQGQLMALKKMPDFAEKDLIRHDYSLCGLYWSRVKKVFRWNTHNLDHYLNKRDALYKSQRTMD